MESWQAFEAQTANVCVWLVFIFCLLLLIDLQSGRQNGKKEKQQQAKCCQKTLSMGRNEICLNSAGNIFVQPAFSPASQSPPANQVLKLEFNCES